MELIMNRLPCGLHLVAGA